MDLISIRNLNKQQLEEILDHVDKIKPNGQEGKILATAFFEPSTRTRLSFQSAALHLGMRYIDFSAEMSSIKKGESFSDTIRMINDYADILAVRHPKEGAARLAADVATMPVVNAGDGGNQHPTQALIDLYTIRKFKKRWKGVKVALMGDLKHARTMHSLVYALGMLGSSMRLISPEELRMDDRFVEEVRTKFKTDITLTHELDLEGIDVIYTCRIQEERFADPYEAKRMKGKYHIGPETLKNTPDAIVLNPLPRMDEIDRALDSTPHAKYFDQARFGVPVRMGVIDYLMRG